MTKKTLWEGAINKKIILLLLIGFLFLVGVSFALWQITLTQEDKNFVTSACFEVTLEEQNDILLESAYPIKDEEGMKLTPYTFTIENVCNTIAFYQVNLEELETNQKKLPDKYIKVSLNHSTGKLLNTYEKVTKTLENATTSHKLTSGSLKEGEKRTYELRLWMDYDTPATNDVMNATFESKISIVAVYKEDIENEFVVENRTLSETYSNQEETIEFNAISKDYNIIEISEDNIVYNPIDNPRKEVTLEKTYTIEGTYTLYFKDEVGNTVESIVETTMLDQTPPEVSFQGEEYLDGIKVDASLSSDEKSKIKTYYYKLNDGEYIESNDSIHTFTGLSDGDYKVTVKLEDNVGNISNEKEMDVTIAYEKVYISNTGNDTNGNGSESKPYASLQRAYHKVKSGGNMILLSNITATSTTTMNIANKNVTLKSNGISVYSIERSSSFLSHLIVVENSNTLTTTNVILDGKSINANGSLIEARYSTLNLNEGTILQNNIHLGNDNIDWETFTSAGGGVYMYTGTINVIGAVISNNSTKYNVGGGGGISIDYGTLNFNSGEVIQNISETKGGGIYLGASTMNMNGGYIKNNSTKQGGGGVGLIGWNGNAYMNLYNGTISNNTASKGGGVWMSASESTCIMTMTNGNITNNNATSQGGGILLNRDNSDIQSIAYLKGGSVSNNTAPTGSNTYVLNGAQILNN